MSDKNFPIFKDNQYSLNSEQILEYVKIFPSKSLNLTKRLYLLICKIYFKDGLTLSCSFKIQDEYKFPGMYNLKSIEDIVNLQQNNIIEYKEGSILKFTDEDILMLIDEGDNPTNDNLRTKFYNQIMKKSKMTKEEYNMLENEIYRETTIENNDFIELQDLTNNYKLFFDYLKKNV